MLQKFHLASMVLAEDTSKVDPKTLISNVDDPKLMVVENIPAVSFTGGTSMVIESSLDKEPTAHIEFPKTFGTSGVIFFKFKPCKKLLGRCNTK